VLDDPVENVQVTYNRVERVDPDGCVVEARSIGDDAGWVAVGGASRSRPSLR
jgi:hypothetical protein